MKGTERYYSMDAVRYFLAISVIVAHFNVITGSSHWWPMSSGTAVGIFFGLSGFLVYDSYRKNPRFWSYLGKRARRILPCYLAIILACAFLLFFVSECGFGEYFLSAKFWRYILANCTFMNFIEPSLPGVFEGHVTEAVNGSLWTLKVEWCLYLCIPLFFWFVNRFSLRVPVVIAAIFAFSVAYSIFMDSAYVRTGNELYHILSYQFCGQFVFFFTGVLFRCLQEKIHQRAWLLALISAVTVTVLCIVPQTDGIVYKVAASLFLPFFSTVLALVASTEIRLPEGARSKIGNCSYEMYLLHFPVIQLINEFAPGNGIALLLISTVVIFLLSWLLQKCVNSVITVSAFL